MSWISKTGRLFAYGVVGLGAPAFAYYSTHSESESGKSLPRDTFPWALGSKVWPVGKISASWTTSSHFKPSVTWDDNWDRRDPKFLVEPPRKNKVLEDKDAKDIENEYKKVQSSATRHLFLIRHGQYNMESDKDAGRFLTALGREQADYTGSRLKELNKPFTKLVNSTMTRATETADIIAKHMSDVPRESCDMLCEGAPIPPEPPVGHWRPEFHQFHEDGARIEAAFRKYFHRAEASQTKDSYEVIVCHANVIRYFVCRALQFPPEGWLRISLNNGSITWVTIRPNGRVSIRTMGDSGHMPAEKLSTT